ncbi:unnamed protein product [Brassica oleracea]|uniref:Uncharacterized protein n=1 Tax=Brassica oleracea TaxID=3712 RepID=A0A3P6GMW3_BRAOL|nr:unnamed protein product [Brassica oleracea]
MFWRENAFLRLWRENTFWRKNAFLQFWQKNTFYDSGGKMCFAIMEGKCVFAVLTENVFAVLGRHHIKQVEEEDDDRNDDGYGSEDRDVNVKDEEDNSDELGLCMWLLPYAFTEPAMTELKSNSSCLLIFPPPNLPSSLAKEP